MRSEIRLEQTKTAMTLCSRSRTSPNHLYGFVTETVRRVIIIHKALKFFVNLLHASFDPFVVHQHDTKRIGSSRFNPKACSV